MIRRWPVVFVLLALSTAANAQNPSRLRIVNIRVGQGDATLILGPADANGNRVSLEAGGVRARVNSILTG